MTHSSHKSHSSHCLLVLLLLLAAAALADMTNTAGTATYIKHWATATLVSDLADPPSGTGVSGLPCNVRVRIMFDATILTTNTLVPGVVSNRSVHWAEYRLIDVLSTNLYTNVVNRLFEVPTP